MAILDIKSYGAVGNGRTDDTRAIRNALTAAAAGGTVYVPAGTYLTSPLVIRSGVTLFGDGWKSKLKLQSGADDYLITLAESRGATCEGSTIRDLHLDCNGGSQRAGGGINLAYSSRCVLHHLQVTTPYHAGVMNTAKIGEPGSWPWENTITSCLFSLGKNSADATNGGYALDLQDAEECYIAGNSFEFNGRAHILENVVGNNAIVGNTFVEGEIGIFSNGSRGRWTNNVFDTVHGHNVRVVGNYNTISDNSFFQPGAVVTAGSSSCIVLDWRATGNSILGNKFYAHSTPGQTRSFILEMFSNTSKNLVAHNQFNLNKSHLAQGITEVQGAENTYSTNIVS